MIEDLLNQLYQKHNVHIKNSVKVKEIVNCLKEDGAKSLQIVSDFDRTITKQHDENGTVPVSSWGILSRCPSVPDQYRETSNALLRKYHPLEVDPTIPLDQKILLMEEWWKKKEAAVKGLKKVSKKEIEEVCLNLRPSVRDGTKELFDRLAELKVPILVLSAGLGDAVIKILKMFDVISPNVKVVSNFFKYDGQGHIEGFQNNAIHVFNKNENALRGSPFYDLILERKNVILMGDSIGDVTMAEGMDHVKNILKIGFLYERSEEALPDYVDAFDIVLQDDQTMDVPRAIINFISH